MSQLTSLERKEKNLTGFSSIDEPWLKQYEFYDRELGSEYITNKTVWEVVKESFEKYSNIPLIEYFGNIISREDFYKYVITWARTFRALGIEKGDYIPLYVPATPESFAIFFAANAIGAIPYYQKLSISKSALEGETRDAKIAVVFDSLWNNVKDVFNDGRFKNVLITTAADSMMFPLKQLTKMKSYFEKRKNNIDIPKDPKYIYVNDAIKLAKYYSGEYEVPFSPNTIAAITTSSGTTSHVVKGIMDSNEGILASILCTINAETGFKKGKRTLTCFPPTASTSLNCLQLLPTLTGGTIVFDPRVDINQWYNQVMKYKPDITISTGSVWEKFIQDLIKKEEQGIKTDLSWVDYFIMGGAGTTPEILDWINQNILERGAQRKICVGYGFSEVFGVLSVEKYNGKYESKNKDVISVGIPMPGYIVGIFDESGNELKYGTGQRGELWIKAPSNMEGYYNKQELTNNTIIDGWIHSGDLCEIDENGAIYCYGRLKNKIVLQNENKYLFDIAIDIRKKFNLHDIQIEKKNLADGNFSVVIYYAQKESLRTDSCEISKLIDEYLLQKYKLVIDGYYEYPLSLAIEPTTLKPKTNLTNGFKKYIDNEEYDISYSEVSLDLYQINVEKSISKQIVKALKTY